MDPLAGSAGRASASPSRADDRSSPGAHPISTASPRRSRSTRSESKSANQPGSPSGKPAIRHVALLIETTGAYGRGLLRGVSRYNREHAGWSVYFHPRGLGHPPPEWLRDWKGDGILVRIDSPAVAEMMLQCKMPVVNLRGPRPDLPFPFVGGDHAQAARFAADHLMERGLRNFGFCSRAQGIHPGLDLRGACFRNYIEAAGFTCDFFPAPPLSADNSWEAEQERLSTWIRHLPKPIGILACNDERGLYLLDACRRCGVAVPDEVAVIGVDNDEFICDLAIPPLTSVDVNSEETGYQAAKLLDQLMNGGEPPARIPMTPTRGVVTRLSTDVVASDDEEVNRAIRFIRDRGSDKIRVMDVLAHLGISRASLQQRMKRVVGRTIHEEIERMRLSRVKELLVKPDMTIKQIARETGFSSVQYLTRVFRAAVGETPARYRNRRDK
jgi:LacI family transcriptional regulator